MLTQVKVQDFLGMVNHPDTELSTSLVLGSGGDGTYPILYIL